MRRALTWMAGLLVLVLVVGLVAVKVVYGRGTPFPSLATQPMLPSDAAEIAIETELPPGMVSVSPEGRVFFTYHPFHRPQDHAEHLVFEWADGVARPVAPALGERLHGVFGIAADGQGRLWAVRPGAMAARPTEVLALDPDTGEIVYAFDFPEGAAGFAQDLRVSADGRFVFLADTGLLRFTDAALLVLDTEEDRWRQVLTDHETTAPQDWVMRRTDGRPYRLGYGLVTFQVGVDGLTLSAEGDWLTYATMTHDGVFRVPTALLTDFRTTEAEIAAAVERVGPGPMSDGIETMPDGGIVLTDVENGGLAVLGPDGTLRTLVARDDVDWADSVSVGPDGAVWFTDSELTALLGPLGGPASLDEMRMAGPFAIYRIPAEVR